MKVLIIGGGIGGLTAGIALEQAGFETQIFEASPEIRVQGAGIWMAPNAMQVFKRLGMARDVLSQGMALDHVTVTDAHLKPIQRTHMATFKEKFGFSITSISRPRLREVLLAHYPREVQAGKRFLRLEQDEERVWAHFADGSTVQGQLLIGADGIASAVREQFLPDSPLRYSGQTCWRGIADISLTGDLEKACMESWGQGPRFGFSVIAPQEVYWFAVKKAPFGGKDPEKGVKAQLQSTFSGFAAPIPAILEATPGDRIIRNDISDLKPLPFWHQGRVCLIGDAAHATTPNLGQGGGQAVEDAWFLAKALKEKSTYREAFASFETGRRKKVGYVVNTSWLVGKMAHIPFGRGLRNWIMRRAPKDSVQKQMDRLYRL